MTELIDYLTDSGHHSNTPAWWNYQFPSGRGANVWLSSTPFCFDMEVDKAVSDDGEVDVYTAQTTDQVRERLAGLAAELADAAAVIRKVLA